MNTTISARAGGAPFAARARRQGGFAIVAKVLVAAALIGGPICVARPAAAQFIQQGTKLVGAGAIGPQVDQANSVAVSADGNTFILGGSADNSQLGAAWVFTRSNGVWTQQGDKLTGSGAVGTEVFQGAAVALSADGNTAIVGGPDRQRGGWRGVGVHAQQRRVDPARRQARRQRRNRASRAGPLRRAFQRRQHRHHGRPQRQLQRRRRMDIHAQQRRLEPARRQAHRHRRGRCI